jgi:hypothetical protein
MGWLALLLHCVSLDLARLCRASRGAGRRWRGITGANASP